MSIQATCTLNVIWALNIFGLLFLRKESEVSWPAKCNKSYDQKGLYIKQSKQGKTVEPKER